MDISGGKNLPLILLNMKEQDFIKIIKDQTKSSYLGDDCAYLKELEIVVTQDNFIEDVHFKTKWATPFQIGYKAAAVNISDVLASGAKPSFISVGLSLPNVDSSFVKELYKGIQKGAHGAQIIGGDITGSDKIFLSITAIGTTQNRKISSRSHAKEGYVIITNGEFGSSAKGLKELQQGLKCTDSILAHLEPELDEMFSRSIAEQINTEYAMMDTSDGLADTLFQIAKASGVKIEIQNINGVFDAEDYKLVAAIPKEFLTKLENYKIIGSVKGYDGVYLQIGDTRYNNYDDLKLYNHFGE